jgi:hypothetical protein
LARRIVRHSVINRVLPKHVDSRLAVLRDPKLAPMSGAELDELAGRITDPNFRIVVEGEKIHLFNRDGHWSGDDPFVLFREAISAGSSVDPQHAFYLGYELSKAVTARTLGKQYTQDEGLSWGYLTVPERRHHGRATPGEPPAAAAESSPPRGDTRR